MKKVYVQHFGSEEEEEGLFSPEQSKTSKKKTQKRHAFKAFSLP